MGQADPFEVTTSIAHYELLRARAQALLPASPLREAQAYWAALRGKTRHPLPGCAMGGEAEHRIFMHSLGLD